MSEFETNDDEALNAQLDLALGKLERLSGELGVFNDELASLETERQQFALLQEVCVGLEKLDALGADGLFWDGRPSSDSGAHHVGNVSGLTHPAER